MRRDVSPWMLVASALVLAAALVSCAPAEDLSEYHVRTAQGVVEGVDAKEPGIRAFLGIPYAAPPVGDGRWRPPAPPEPWDGIRSAHGFGPRCIQTNPFPDMLFQSAEESEDCLSLSIWAPSETEEPLPVMVWIHGGGYFSGAGDEERHDGSVLASRDVVVVTLNYRLGVLGFLAHPELSQESPAGASGDYGLLDQIAALEWVRDNIAAFGGDPSNVTIFGESAGSAAVSALMASPLAAGLFHRAIGQSGGHFSPNALSLPSLEEAERAGTTFAAEVGAASLAELRALEPADLIAVASRNAVRFRPIVDGHVLPRPVWDIFADGEQAQVPLLAGWTSSEIKVPRVSAAEFDRLLAEVFPDDLDAAREVFPAGTDEEAWHSAIALRSEWQFVGFGTWKWLELHARTGGAPSYRYLFDQPRPGESAPAPEDDPGAAHATDIEFVFGTLDTLPLAWDQDDRRVSDMMVDWWTNFARSGDPNGGDLPAWPRWDPDGSATLMLIHESAAAEPETTRARFEFFDRLAARHRAGG